MIRLSHILFSMALILLAGVLSARHLERRMGVSAVPGLVLLDCPELGASALQDMSTLWPAATLEWVPAGQGRFLPFDGTFVARHVRRGDAVALFSSIPVDRELEAAEWPVVLEGYPGEAPGPRAAAVAASVARFMEQRPGSRPFVVGVALEPGLTVQEVTVAVSLLVDVARAYPGSRRTALIVLGKQSPEAIAGHANQRWSLRIPIGDWNRQQEEGLRDLLETAGKSPAGPDR